METNGINFKISAETGNLTFGIKKAEDSLQKLSISGKTVSATTRTAAAGIELMGGPFAQAATKGEILEKQLEGMSKKAMGARQAMMAFRMVSGPLLNQLDAEGFQHALGVDKRGLLNRY